MCVLCPYKCIAYGNYEEVFSDLVKPPVRLLPLKEALLLPADSVTGLTLAGGGFWRLPDTVLKFRNLRALSLRDCRYINVDTLFEQLQVYEQLEYLDLSGLNLTHLPMEIGKLQKLRILVLSRNKQLTYLPEELSRLTSLEVFVCRQCYLLPVDTLFDLLGEAGTIKHLDLSYCQLFSLPLNISRLQNLETLNLTGNVIVRLPPTLTTLKNLKYVNLRHNLWLDATEAFGVLSRLPSLRILSLADCDLRQLPAGVGAGFPSLEVLDLRGNSLQSLPRWICGLSALRVLDIGHLFTGERLNQLKELPTCLGELHSLEVLLVPYNQIEKLPSSLARLPSLKVLDLSLNRIEQLGKRRSLPVSLEVLLLGGNRISRIPDWFGELANLRVVDLSAFFFYPPSWKIHKLPPTIGKLSHLHTLLLTDQLLSRLPPEICALSYLQRLDLQGNLLREVPECIGELSSLKFLNLKANELKTLPSTLVRLRALDTLIVAYNLPLAFASTLQLLTQMSWLKYLDVGLMPWSSDTIVTLLKQALPKTQVIADTLEEYERVPPPFWLRYYKKPFRRRW